MSDVDAVSERLAGEAVPADVAVAAAAVEAAQEELINGSSEAAERLAEEAVPGGPPSARALNAGGAGEQEEPGDPGPKKAPAKKAPAKKAT